MIAVAFSWKVSFVLIMIIGLVWALIWFKFVKELAPTEDAPAMKAAIQSHEQHIPMTFYLKQNGSLHGFCLFRLQLHFIFLLNMVSELSGERTRFKC